MTGVQDTFKHNRARKHVIVGGGLILVCITLLSCVSSFMIYKEGFSDMTSLFQHILALSAVIVVEGAFIWLVYGFTRAFASSLERTISFAGMLFLVTVMLINIVTHFMMVKNIELVPFQHSWISWGAVTVFIAVLLIVLGITLADPLIRLIRLELRYLGKQQEIILTAKTEGLDSDKIQEAMASRADWEAGQLASKIMGGAQGLQSTHHSPIGFRRGQSDSSQDYDNDYGDNYAQNNGTISRDHVPKGKRR